MRLRSHKGEKTLSSNSFLSVPDKKPNAKLRLLCFPYAGGMKEIYMPWVGKITDEVELVIVQYPGHIPGLSEERIEDMEKLVEVLITHLDIVFNKPYVVFGHSMGCRVILELIRQLKNKNKPLPSCIFASANKPPHLVSIQPPVQHLTIDEAIEVVKHFDILPLEITNNKEILEMILPIYISDFKLLDTFTLDKKILPLHIPIYCFSGINDNLAYPKEMKEWKQYTDSRFELMELEDKHYFINNNNLRQTIIDRVVSCIQKEGLL